MMILGTIPHATQTFKELARCNIYCRISICRLCFGTNDRPFTKNSQLDAFRSIRLARITFVSQLHINTLCARIELSDFRQLFFDIRPEIGVNLSIACNDGDIHHGLHMDRREKSA